MSFFPDWMILLAPVICFWAIAGLILLGVLINAAIRAAKLVNIGVAMSGTFFVLGFVWGIVIESGRNVQFAHQVLTLFH